MANPQKVFIMIGTNDIYLSDSNINDSYTIMTIFNNYEVSGARIIMLRVIAQFHRLWLFPQNY